MSEQGASPVRLNVTSGRPSAEELAAVIAVVTEAYESEAAAAVTDDAPKMSAWQVSARALRAPVRRDVAWGRFVG